MALLVPIRAYRYAEIHNASGLIQFLIRADTHVSQGYIDLLRTMSGNDKPFIQPANGLIFLMFMDKRKDINSNVDWLKASLNTLGKVRIKDDAKDVALTNFKSKWMLLEKDYRPSSQKEADDCSFNNAVQRVWLSADKSMMNAGVAMHGPWKKVFSALNMPTHLDRCLASEAGTSADGDGGDPADSDDTMTGKHN